MKNIFWVFVYCLTLSACAQDVSIDDRTDRVVFTVDPNLEISLVADFSSAELIVSGPLFGKTGKPVGGIIENGRWIQEKLADGPEIENWGANFNFANLGGVFTVGKDGLLHIYHYAERIAEKNVKFGFQSGPILVSNGIISQGQGAFKLPQTKHKSKRAGIGCRDGKIVVIISKEKISLSDFAKIFVEENVSDALYLDGFQVVYRYKGEKPVGGVPKGVQMLKFSKHH
jgi:uncharacterized protein YigE (DUF2233 family)